MKRLIVLSVTCLCLLFTQLGLAPIALANAGNTNVYETALTSADTSLSGMMTSKHFYFDTEEYWNVSHVTLNLDYKASPLTIGDRSSVTLTVNGTKLHSFRPSADDEQKKQLTLKVPKEMLIKGNNTISVEGYIETRIENQLCVPPENRDNWLQIYKTSNVAVHYTNKAMDGSISDFNERFSGMDTIDADQNAIVVPTQSDPAELEAAVYALSGFAKSNSLKSDTIPMLTFDSDNVKNKKIVTAVALYDHLPQAIRAALPSEDLNSKALIQVVNTNTQPTLVITSNNPELLVKAGRLVANQPLMMQLSAGSKIVDEDTVVDTPPVNITKQVTLTETGDQVKGAYRQEKSYFVALPANRSIAAASKISLDMRYAKNLDFDRSMVTVFINDKPIGSKKLTSEMANADTLELTIPQNLGISGNFTVTVAFDLEMKNATCIRPQDEMPWGFITKDSMLQLNTKDRTEMLFNDYPNPFLRDGSFNQVAVVMPQERDSYTYLALSNLFNLLGQYAEGNTGSIRFYNDNVGKSELADRNIIALGNVKNNKVIRDHNDKLYFKYGADGAGFVSNEKMSIEEDYGKRLGTLQLIESPYEAGHGLLAVTGASSEYYYLASKMLADETSKYSVFGDGVATDKDGNVFAHRFKQQAEQNQSSLLSDVLERSDVLGFMVAVILIFVLVLVSLILMLRKYRKKRGKSDETESE